MPLKRSPRPVPAGRLPPLSRPGQRTPERSPRRVVPTDADAGDDRRDSGDTAMKRDVSPEKIRLALEATRASWVIKPSAPKDASPEKETASWQAARVEVERLGIVEGEEMDVADVLQCAREHAARKLKEVHGAGRVTAYLNREGVSCSMEARLEMMLQTLDEDGDGEVSNDEIVSFCARFAEQQLAHAQDELAKEVELREAAEGESRTLRTRVVFLAAGMVVMALLLTLSTAANLFGTRGRAKIFSS